LEVCRPSARVGWNAPKIIATLRFIALFFALLLTFTFSLSTSSTFSFFTFSLACSLAFSLAFPSPMFVLHT
jgi:hypothetical protein